MTPCLTFDVHSKTMKVITLHVLVAVFFAGGAIVSCSSLPDVEMPTVPPNEKETYISSYVREGGVVHEMRSDAVELDPGYKEIFGGIDDEVDRALRFNRMRGKFGFGQTYSAKKREILWKKYGIDWHPIQALTPNLRID